MDNTQEIREEIEESLTHIIPRKPFPQYIDDTVFLEVKELLEKHPDKLSKSWSENPRLYTLLRMLGYYDDTTVFQKFDTEKIGDFWLPVGTATLNQLSSSVGFNPQHWRSAQRHVLSKSELMSEEKLLSQVPSHRYIQYGSSHFEEIEKIGKGGSAEVVRVRHKLSGQQFACKRILRADNVKAQRNQLIEFEQEVGVLQRISHNHTVSFVASFTDLTSFSLILNPVAKDVLKSVLERQSREKPLPESQITILRRSIGCLATALQYLHEQRVRHKDIKPGNILLSEGRVYLCDFGIARDWSKSEHSTTEGDVMKFTRRYCAPEVFGRDPRNTKSDIWSLGCVYLEILSVVKGYSLEEVNKFFLEQSEGLSGQGLWRAPEAMRAWLEKLRSEKNDSADDIPLDWITPMVRTEPEDRLKASELVVMIHKQSADLPQPGLFIATCCARTDSVVPDDAIDSPTLHEPVYNAFGIKDNSVSSPKGYRLDIPHRSSSPSSSNAPRSRHKGSRDRSISPRTSIGPRSSSDDTVPFSVVRTVSRPEMPPFSSTGVSSHHPLPHHTASRSGSPRSSSLFSAHVPESEIPSTPRSRQRSPVPPPASFELKCACASLLNEKHIFNVAYTTVTPIDFDSEVPTIDTCAKCEIGENRVQIYESLPQDPSSHTSSMPLLWWVTRRLVVSYLSGQPEMRHCSAFWIPLADIRFALSGKEVTLHFSDCNQMTERRSPNYGQHYDWIYNPKDPNNVLKIAFNDIVEAEQFVDVIRLPYGDGATAAHRRRVDISDTSEINIFDIGRLGVRNYRAATVTNISSTIHSSKLFIQWPEVDLVMQNQDSNDPNAPYQMRVEMRNVSTPTYHSNVRGEPAADYDKVARFNTAHLLKTSMIVEFPIQAEVARLFPKPPLAVVNMLQSLTGWTLSYFAIVSKFKSKNKRFGSKKYGRSDVMLWAREVNDITIGAKSRGAAVTFRMHEEGEWPWVSGSITHSTSIEYPSGLDATITVSSKSRGKLLDVGKVTAIASENMDEQKQRHRRSTPEASEELSDLVLTFEDSRYRLEFVTLIEKYKRAAAPLPRALTSANSMHRINTLASMTEPKGPPMR